MLAAWLLLLPAMAAAAAPWHDDLTQAREASRASRRPVLAIFTASWQPGGNAVADTALGTPDARALVASCFEPVIIDVDRHVELTRRLGIRHVPTAAVLGDQDEVLASFECPATTPEFVVAAAQAAQEATARRDRLEDANRRTAAAAQASGPGRSNAAISMVTSKVRQLSDFASQEPMVGGATAIATTASYHQSNQQPNLGVVQEPPAAAAADHVYADRFAAAPGLTPSTQAAPGQDTPFTRKPPAWPAEQPLAPLATTIAGPPAQPPAVEPVSVAAPAAVGQQPAATPWLQAAAPAAASTTVATATDAESSASVSDIPATPPGSAATAAAGKKPSPGEQFLAALQKPFAGFARKPAADPVTGLPQPPAAPPTMPPARTQWPGIPLAGSTRPAAPAAATAPTAAAPATAPSQSPALPYGQAPTYGQAPVYGQPQAPTAQQAQAQPPAVASQPPGPTQQVATSQGSSPVQADESMPLGLEGYCPVTLAAKGAWAEGRAQYGVRHRGRTYLFAGAAEQQTFLADPDRYAPALSGDDPVIACEQGRSLPGQRRFGLTCDSRMYLFSSPETRAAFQAQPDRYTARIARAEQTASTASRTY